MSNPQVKQYERAARALSANEAWPFPTGDKPSAKLTMTVAEATAIAIDMARKYPERYYTHSADFIPHEWVIRAILKAANG